jgi:dTDP-4-dehydrorhamnose reductase
MKIVITGRQGQIVQSLLEKAVEQPDLQVIALGRPELDLLKPDTVHETIITEKPDLVISAAAYTAVDLAEIEPELTFAINATGAQAVAEAARFCDVPIIHFSTDYVFAGLAERPYVETDPPSPRSVYGHSKLEGERRVQSVTSKNIILRTAWVYSPFGKNFVKTMLKFAETRDVLQVVSDQWGNPTSALDIADAIIHIAYRLALDPDFTAYGIYHLVGTGDTNWSDFARAIFDESKMLGGPTAIVSDVVAADYMSEVTRPENSRLSTVKFQEVFGWAAPEWTSSLRKVVAELV